jgi:hypothetical protein
MGPPGFGPPPQFGPPPGPPPPQPGFGDGSYPAPPPVHGPPGFGAQPQVPGGGGARCVQGHAIPPGGSFCMEGGHPIALEGMQIGNAGDAFGATAFAPGPPGQAPGGPMPPTSAMSGFGAEPHPPPPAPPPPMQQAQAQQAVGKGERRALAGFLVSFQDDPLGKFWPLHQGKNSVGRAETGQDVDVAIGHGTTSTHHASVECEGPRFTLSDLGSTNGTFHNEEAIGFQGRREVRDGDKIRFGGYSVFVVNVVGRG